MQAAPARLPQIPPILDPEQAAREKIEVFERIYAALYAAQTGPKTDFLKTVAELKKREGLDKTPFVPMSAEALMLRRSAPAAAAAVVSDGKLPNAAAAVPSQMSPSPAPAGQMVAAIAAAHTGGSAYPSLSRNDDEDSPAVLVWNAIVENIRATTKKDKDGRALDADKQNREYTAHYLMKTHTINSVVALESISKEKPKFLESIHLYGFDNSILGARSIVDDQTYYRSASLEKRITGEDIREAQKAAADEAKAAEEAEKNPSWARRNIWNRLPNWPWSKKSNVSGDSAADHSERASVAATSKIVAHDPMAFLRAAQTDVESATASTSASSSSTSSAFSGSAMRAGGGGGGAGAGSSSNGTGTAEHKSVDVAKKPAATRKGLALQALFTPRPGTTPSSPAAFAAAPPASHLNNEDGDGHDHGNGHSHSPRHQQQQPPRTGMGMSGDR